MIKLIKGDFIWKKQLKPSFLFSAILISIIALGPYGWFFIHLFNEEYHRLALLFVISNLMTAVVCFYWSLYFKFKRTDKEELNDELEDINNENEINKIH